jgi:integrase
MTADILQLPLPQQPKKPTSYNLTDALAKKLPVPPKDNKVFFDSTVAGFGCRVTKNDARAYVLAYRTRAGRKRLHTIGDIGNWRCTAARIEAKRLKQIVDQGGDPLGDIEALREAPTVGELCDRFLAEHVTRKRPSTARAYAQIVDLHLRPALGSLKVEALTFADCDGLHRRMTRDRGAHIANRAIAVLSKMLNLAIRWGMRSDNPTRGIERNPEGKRKRYLTGDELARLITALDAHTDRQTADIVRLLTLTGARRGEVLAARWADIDLKAGVWTKPGSTTKQKTDHVTPLSPAAIEMLSAIRAAQAGPHRAVGEFVFPSHAGGGHVTDIKKGWRSICKAAGIEGLRVHDLRHSFASMLVSDGASLPLIGALLGHSNPTTTARYSHLYDDPLRAAVGRVGAAIAAARKPEPPPKPVRIKRHGA